MRFYRLLPALIAMAWVVALVVQHSCHASDQTPGLDPVDERALQAHLPLRAPQDGRWIGNAVCYGPHRNGQRPGGPSPTAAEIREDLRLMLPHWNLLRIYGSSEFARTLLAVIRSDSLDMKVMLGVWIAVEERRDDEGVLLERLAEAAAANRREVDAAIRLAAEFPKIVVAVSVGNETQIFWSAHRSPLETLIKYVRDVRAGVAVPVTVADDFNFWNKSQSQLLATEIDFITMHAHPMWNGVLLENALEWLRKQVATVRAMHAGRTVVLGETGWATSVHNVGEQAELIRGRPGENEQKRFYDAVRAWAYDERGIVFFFEAFDENWKGGAHPDEVEKHWGLFRADRTSKAAMSARE